MSHHYSDCMVIRCSDDRYSPDREFEAAFLAILKKEKATDCFKAYGFGAGMEIIKKDNLQLWLDRIRLATSLGITRIILIQHLDCGAIKDQYKPVDKESERQHNLDIILETKNFFAQHAPNLKLSAYLQDFDTFEQIV